MCHTVQFLVFYKYKFSWQKYLLKIVIIILIRWKNGEKPWKTDSIFSSAACYRIYSYHFFSKVSSLFIITVLFVYIDGLSEYLKAYKIYTNTLFRSTNFNSSPLSLIFFDFISAWSFLIPALILFWSFSFFSLDYF